MANKIKVIAEIIPAGSGFPVVSAEHVKVNDKTLDQLPTVVISETQPAEANCLWIKTEND